jgi:hypothetical protein
VNTIEVHALSGAYVLSALDKRDMARFTRHLASCPVCLVEVAELSETAARMADDTWAVPPPRLRSRLMSKIKRVRQQPPVTATTRNSWWAWLRPAFAPRPLLAGAAAACLVATGVAVVEGYQLREANQVAAQAKQQVDEVQRVLTADGATIHSSGVTGGGTMTAVTAPSMDQAVLMLSTATPPDGRVYQLWLIESGTASSLAVLEPGQRNVTALVAAGGEKALYGLTLEPVGGSPSPTLPILAQTRTETVS